MTVFQQLFNCFFEQYVDTKRHDGAKHARQIAEIMIQLDNVEQTIGDQFASIYRNWVEYRIAIEQLKIHNKQFDRSIDFVLETLERGADAKYSDLEWLFFKNFQYKKTFGILIFFRHCMNSIDYINVMNTANQNAGVQPESEPETPSVQLA